MKIQKTFIGVVLLFVVLALAACVANPVEMLEEEAAEQIAEQIIEQAGGAEDVQIEVDGDDVSYTVDDGEGGEISVEANSGEEIKAIAGMGFDIALPDGLANGVLQRVDDNGKEMMVNATFDLENISGEEFYQTLHNNLLAQGFTYSDMGGNDVEAPDFSDQASIPPLMVYMANGAQFTIMGDGSSVILGLMNTETGE